MEQPYQSYSNNRTAALVAAIVSFSVIMLALAFLCVFKTSEVNSNALPAGNVVASKSDNDATPIVLRQAANLKTTRGAKFDPNKPPPAEVPDFLPSTARLINAKPTQVRVDSWKHSRYYAGNDNTSDGFATSVYNEFLTHYSTFAEQGVVSFKAISPRNNLRYQMVCQDHGKFVACTGGYKAVVYIV